jgi:hypothetical protein
VDGCGRIVVVALDLFGYILQLAEMQFSKANDAGPLIVALVVAIGAPLGCHGLENSSGQYASNVQGAPLSDSEGYADAAAGVQDEDNIWGSTQGKKSHND